MPKLAATLSSLFPELPLHARIAAAAVAGFHGVEIPFPYDSPAVEIRNALGRAALPLVLIAAPPPNYTGGPPGFAAVPGAEERFRHDFRRALRYGEALKARHLHVMAGVAEGARAFDTLVGNLRWAADHAPGHSLLIEPMNRRDLPGYFLNDLGQAAEVIAAVAAPGLGMIFDSCHVHHITGDLLAGWDRVAPLVRHVQLAAPDRGEPDAALAPFTARLAADGYDGWIGADYTPRRATLAGLGWMEALRPSA